MAWSDWTLGEEVGRGAMGRVLRAQSARTGAPVAVKTVAVPDPRYFARVAREAAAMARLDHANVLAIHDFGSVPADSGIEPGLWIAMDWWGGGSALGWRPSSFAEVAEATGQLLEALAHAHAHGVVHRDVKPANLLFSGDRRHLVLADFGLATASRAAGSQRSGTPGHMAPEQVLGRPQGPWTDLYAVGVVVWTWLTGAPPFSGEVDEVLQAQVATPPPRFQARCSVPAGVETWLRTCLAKDPLERYPSAGAARRALGELHRLPRVDWLAVPRSTARTDVGVRVLWPLRTPPLVGREAAWEALRAVWREVGEQGGVRTFGLRGPDGSGRRSLGKRFLLALAHAGVPVASIGDGGPTEIAAALRELLANPSDAQWVGSWAQSVDRADLESEIVAFAQNPTLTGSALDLLAEVLAAGRVPVAVAVAAEPGPVVAALRLAGADALVVHTGPDGEGVALGPLGPEDVVELVAQALGEGAEVAREAWSATGGHPGALIGWLTLRRGLGFPGRLPNASEVSAQAARVGRLVGFLPQPAELEVVRSLAGDGADAALLELTSVGAVRLRWRRAQMELDWHEALCARDSVAAAGERGQVGELLVADDATAIEGLALLARSDRPSRAVAVARRALDHDVAPELLVEPLRALDPHVLDGSDAWLVRLIRGVGAVPGKVAVEAHRVDTRQLLAEWPAHEDAASILATAVRLESVCQNAYRDPELAAEVASAVGAVDGRRSVPTGWGALIRSMNPWRSGSHDAIPLLQEALERAHAAGVVRAEWAAACQLGQFYASVGRPVEAVELTRRAVALRPDEPSVRVLLALGLEGIGAADAEIEAHLDAAAAEVWRLRPRLRTWLKLVRCRRALDRHGAATRDAGLEHELRGAERAAEVHAQPAQAAQAALMTAVYAALHGDREHAEAAWRRFAQRLSDRWAEPHLIALADRLAAVAEDPLATEAERVAERLRAMLATDAR
jgi:serine/threonine protein kinase